MHSIVKCGSMALADSTRIHSWILLVSLRAQSGDIRILYLNICNYIRKIRVSPWFCISCLESVNLDIVSDNELAPQIDLDVL